MASLVLSKVESSNIEAIGYDSENSLLAVQFKNTGVYLYHGVPAEIFSEMEAAPSAGSFFSQRIKAAYKFTKLQLESFKLKEKTEQPVEMVKPVDPTYAQDVVNKNG